jgi:uncharacterized protein
MKPPASRWRGFLARVRSHPWRTAILILLIAFLLLNVLAYQHARAMLTFDADSARTPPPQSLSLWQKIKVLACGISVPRPTNTRAPEDFGLSFRTIRFASDDEFNLEGWLVEPPHSRGTVILFHGYAASRSSLLEQAQAFHGMSFSTFLVDFRGSGGSDGNRTTLGIDEARDVAAAVRQVGTLSLPRPLVLYGQSMGGAAVLRSIAAFGTSADAVILESVFDRMLTTVRNRFALMGVPSFPAAEALVFWGGVQVGFSGFDHNPKEYARACDIPTLVLHGAADCHAKPEEGKAIYENLAGEKQMELFPDVGHTCLCKEDRKRWQAVVSRFLEKQVEKSAP